MKQKYQLLINKRESVGLKQYDHPKVLLNIKMIWMIFMKIWMNTIQIKNVKY